MVLTKTELRQLHAMQRRAIDCDDLRLHRALSLAISAGLESGFLFASDLNRINAHRHEFVSADDEARIAAG